MKKKLALLLAIVMAGGIVFSTQFVGKKGSKSVVADTKKEEKKNVKFSVRYAFADVDMDQIIQEKDPKDDDQNADYLFVKFTSPLDRRKKDSNLGNIKNFKLDNKELPKGTEMLMNDDIKDMLIIKLPQGYLKGQNSGHVLEISKDLVNGENKITGDLKLNLPYSEPIKSDNKKSESSKTSSNDNNDKSNNSSADNKTNNTDVLPKYTVEVGKGIPFTTVVLVKLQTPKVEEYKVSIDNVELKIKENAKKEKVFVGSVKKDYSYDEVMSKLKIEKKISKK
ncbi:MAG: hypothetical protein GX982_04185 [Tissierellia bacterium]|nr:hypothetical protein [Tissierellia bacterium]